MCMSTSRRCTKKCSLVCCFLPYLLNSVLSCVCVSRGSLTDYDLITVGETPFTHDASALAQYVLPKNKELNMVFNFEHMDIDSPDYSPLVRKAWTLPEFKDIIRRWQQYKRDEGFWNT